MNSPERLAFIAEQVRALRHSGASARTVAELAKDLLGEPFPHIAFRYVLQTGLGVGFRTAAEAAQWHGLEDGPHAISDDALEALLAPWLAMPR
ncbi:hypothetical protein ACWEHA_20755 [Amycolatopsis nivea]